MACALRILPNYREVGIVECMARSKWLPFYQNQLRALLL